MAFTRHHFERSGHLDGSLGRGRPHAALRRTATGLVAAALLATVGVGPIYAAGPSDGITVSELQPGKAGTADNDSQATAQRLTWPATSAARGQKLRISGQLDSDPVKAANSAPNREDDGSIRTAGDLGLTTSRRAITTSGRVGDGPHGTSGDKTGDFDFYRTRAVPGDLLTVDVAPDEKLPPLTLLYDAKGNLLVASDGHLSYPVDRAGDYFVAIGSGATAPNDPFDSASGQGVASEGDYRLQVARRPAGTADRDVYALWLRRGDVLGVTVTGAANRVAISKLDGTLVQSSLQDAGVIYPKESPLPRGGNATANHVVDHDGLYFITINDGSGRYGAEVTATPAPSVTGAAAQTLYLDFSGPTIDNRIFGESAISPGSKKLSPLRTFLPRWGLPASAEEDVIRLATRRFEEIMRDDVPGSQVRVVNSSQSPNLFGKPDVSRVVIGGTIQESGLIPAFGLAQSVDPGNFAREETAIVLPDIMSLPNLSVSLNSFLGPNSDRVKAVSQAIGNAAAHEAGHFLGNHHTYDRDNTTSLMNTGNLLHVYAVGRDKIAGTQDDDRIAFETGRYDPMQGFVGTMDSRSRTRFALSTARSLGSGAVRR